MFILALTLTTRCFPYGHSKVNLLLRINTKGCRKWIYVLTSYSFPGLQWAWPHTHTQCSYNNTPQFCFLYVISPCTCAAGDYRLACFVFVLYAFSISRSPSYVAETRSSPCSMPLWSRSCCMNRAWPILPKSWQNLKLSREVFANQDLKKSSFQWRSVKWNVCVTDFSLFWIASIKGLTAEVDGE